MSLTDVELKTARAESERLKPLSSKLTGGDPVLARQWMALARSEDVTDRPVRAELLGEAVVLWRSETGLQAFRDLCIHRGAALSLGHVEGGELVCPYHGWRYGGDGACTRIPAQPAGAKVPTKARALTYLCQERYGLVWVALETPETEVPLYTEATEPGFYTLSAGPYVLQAEPPRVIENFLDVSHLMWVHEGLLGVPDYAEIPDHHVHRVGDTLRSDPIDIFQPDPDGRGKALTNRYVYEVLAPTTARFRKTDPDTGEVFSMLLHATPTAAGETLAYALLSRNYDLDASDETYIDFQNTLMAQDKRIIESQRPENLPLDLQAELHLKSDRLAIAYRRYLQELGVERGTA